jgi:hypothetical protein
MSIYIACAALLVDATPGSLATPEVSALRRSRNFLIPSAHVVLCLFDSLDSALFARALSVASGVSYSCIWASLLDLCVFFCQFLIFVAHNFCLFVLKPLY